MEYSSECDNSMTESPKVWTELQSNITEKCESDGQQTIQKMETDSNCQIEVKTTHESSYLPQLHCLESGDGTGFSVTAVLQSDSIKRPYCPSSESRQLHNHKERLRRSRMKCSCDALRALVPGLTDKTDKATVLEHTVAFLFHLSKCPGVKCDDYLPSYPPPMSAKLLQLYPTLMTGEYQYYETIPTTDSEFANPSAESHIIEVHESDGTQYVITSDGSQYMVVDATDGDQLMAATNERTNDSSAQQKMDTNDENAEQGLDFNGMTLKEEEPMKPTPEECCKSVAQVLDMLDDNKENIDPNAVTEEKPIRKKRAYRKRNKTEDTSKAPTIKSENDIPKVRKQRKLKQKSKNE